MRLAIFDFDGTILRGNSWQVFLRREFRRRPSRAPLLLLMCLLRLAGLCAGSQLRAFALRGLRGLSTLEVESLSEALHRDALAALVRPAALAEIERRRAAGYRIVLATGAFDFLVGPLAADVRADDVVATTVAWIDGRCTGRIVGSEALGEAKAAAIRARFPGMTHADWQASCAYTDSAIDLPLLELVGERYLVRNIRAPDKPLPAGTQVICWDAAA